MVIRIRFSLTCILSLYCQDRNLGKCISKYPWRQNCEDNDGVSKEMDWTGFGALPSLTAVEAQALAACASNFSAVWWPLHSMTLHWIRDYRVAVMLVPPTNPSALTAASDWPENLLVPTYFPPTSLSSNLPINVHKYQFPLLYSLLLEKSRVVYVFLHW